jgi:hypothetical protein
MNANINTAEFSPNTYSRIGGIFYLFIIIAGLFTELFIRGTMIVSHDASATFINILSSPFSWRVGIAADIIMHICDIPLLMIFYVLLKPVNRNLALAALLFILAQSAVMVSAKLNLFTPLFLSADAEYLKAFNPQQLKALSYVSIRADAYGFGIGLIFFGCGIIILGYLIFKSGYFPKTIGILLQIAGICYLINSFALILDPKLADQLFPVILLPSFIGELSLGLWMLIKGVNMAKWNERVNAWKFIQV